MTHQFLITFVLTSNFLAVQTQVAILSIAVAMYIMRHTYMSTSEVEQHNLWVRGEQAYRI